jgi:hypothetical protein
VRRGPATLPLILAGAHSVTTASLHAFKGATTGCEITGTTVKSEF